MSYPENIAQDAITGTLGVIDLGHLEIHKGDLYQISQALTATSNLLFVVPAGKTAHLVSEAVGDGVTILEVYPNVTASANGTAFSQIFNANTNSAKVPETVVTTTPTVTSTLDATTRMFYAKTPAGCRAGILDRSTGEMILKPGKHLIRTTWATGTISLQIRWYEEAA